MAAAAAAVVGVKKEIGGLLQAALLLDSHGKVRVEAVVTSVEVRHAPALLQLLRTATAKRKKAVAQAWNLARDQKLRHVARISCEADVLLDVVMPLLKSDPRSVVGRRLLTRYGWSLLRVARKVDGPEGPFSDVARQICNALRRHSFDMYKGKLSLPKLRANLYKLEARLNDDIKRAVVTIPKVEVQDQEDEYDDGDDEVDGGEANDEVDGGEADDEGEEE